MLISSAVSLPVNAADCALSTDGQVSLARLDRSSLFARLAEDFDRFVSNAEVIATPEERSEASRAIREVLEHVESDFVESVALQQLVAMTISCMEAMDWAGKVRSLEEFLSRTLRPVVRRIDRYAEYLDPEAFRNLLDAGRAAPDKRVSHRIEGGVVHLKVSILTQGTSVDIEEAMVRARDEATGRLRGYILDLRDCPGGLLDVAVEVADNFLAEGQIVSTSRRRSSDNMKWSASPADRAEGLPLVVLVNGKTGGGAEIVAAALQENHRASVMGKTTVGKSSIQQVFPIEGRRWLKLTTARMLTPRGTSFGGGQGIVPDVTLESEACAPYLTQEDPIFACAAATIRTASR